jgi:hypothetical protein
MTLATFEFKGDEFTVSHQEIFVELLRLKLDLLSGQVEIISVSTVSSSTIRRLLASTTTVVVGFIGLTKEEVQTIKTLSVEEFNLNQEGVTSGLPEMISIYAETPDESMTLTILALAIGGGLVAFCFLMLAMLICFLRLRRNKVVPPVKALDLPQQVASKGPTSSVIYSTHMRVHNFFPGKSRQ